MSGGCIYTRYATKIIGTTDPKFSEGWEASESYNSPALIRGMTVDKIDHLAPRVPKSDFDALFVPRVAWKLAIKRASGNPRPRLSKTEMRCTAFEVRCIWFVRCLREKTLRRKRARRAARSRARRQRRRQRRLARLRSRHRETIDELLVRSKNWYQETFGCTGSLGSTREQPSLSQDTAPESGCDSSPVNSGLPVASSNAPRPSEADVEGNVFQLPNAGYSNADLVRSFYSISDGGKVAELVSWTRLFSDSFEIRCNAYGEELPNHAAMKLISQGYTIARAIVDSRFEYLTPFLEWGSLARMWLDGYFRSHHPGFREKYIFCLSHRPCITVQCPNKPVFLTYPQAGSTVYNLSQTRFFEAHRVIRTGEEVLIASLELRFRQTRDWSRCFSS